MEIMSSWASGMFWVKWFGVIPDAPMAGDHPSYPGGTRTMRAGYQDWTVPGGEHTEDIVQPDGQIFITRVLFAS